MRQIKGRRQFKRRKVDYAPYHSGYEFQIAQWLSLNGYEFEYEPKAFPYWQPVGRCKCSACGDNKIIKSRTYTPDWYLPKFDLWIESKGRFLGSDRTKMIAVRAEYPDLNIKILFMKQDTFGTRKTTYTEWATKHRYDSAISPNGVIPPEWLTKDKT